MSTQNLHDDQLAGREAQDFDDEDWQIIETDELSTRSPPHHNASSSRSQFHLRTGRRTYTYDSNPHADEMPHRLRDENSAIVAVQPQAQSPLFKLPAEVRMLIYESLLKSPNPEVRLRKFPRSPTRPSDLSILQSCRRVLMEAESVFYSINRFLVPLRSSFLADIGDSRQAALTSIAWTTVNPGGAFVDLTHLTAHPILCRNLRSLHMRRVQKITFTNVSSWAVMAARLRMELEKMHGLRNFETSMPSADMSIHGNQARQQRLDEIDDKLRDVVRNRVRS